VFRALLRGPEMAGRRRNDGKTAMATQVLIQTPTGSALSAPFQDISSCDSVTHCIVRGHTSRISPNWEMTSSKYHRRVASILDACSRPHAGQEKTIIELIGKG